MFAENLGTKVPRGLGMETCAHIKYAWRRLPVHTLRLGVDAFDITFSLASVARAPPKVRGVNGGQYGSMCIAGRAGYHT